MPVQIFRAGDTLNPNESISSLPAKPGDTITFDVVYETKNDNGTTPAVGGETLKPFPLYVNFNSNELALVPGTAKYPNTYGSTPLIKAENLAVTPDTADEDAGQPNSQETNAYIFATWLSFSDWTGLDSQPAPLLRLSFNVLDGFNGSTVNFTTIAKEQQDSAPGFTFTPQSLQLVAPTTAGITVAPTTGLTTSESGTPATFTVKLDTQPTADVTIPVASSNTAEGTAAPTSLVFTAANWNTAQTVTVTGVADNTVDADKPYTIQLQPAVSTDPNYTGIDATDVSVTNTNVDVAKIIVAPTTGLTSESGTTTTFTVKLDTKPTADVTIPVLSSNTAEGTAAPTSLVFTAANWDTAQTVTVTGVADKTVDADQVYTIQLQPAVSTDPNYTGKDATDVSVTNTNVDVANITVAPTTGLTSESGTTTTFTVKLDTKPTADVTIPVASSNTAEGTAAPTSLVFTAANWDTAQTVTVTGVADGIVDADQAYTIQLQPAVSDDANYTGIDAADVQVTNTNIDQVIKQVDPPPTPNITVTPTSGLTTDESGKTATFTVKLDTQPTADVTIPVLSSDPKEGTAAPTSLVFTAANWDTAQTVTVTGVADGIVDADKLYTIQLQAAVSDDPNYTGKDATDVDVTNTNIAVTLPTDEIDTLQGGEGENRFVLTGTPPTKPSSPSDTGVTEDKNKPNEFSGTANDDVIIRSSGDETLLGNQGNDFLSGEGDGDELFGGVDNDTLVGGSGGQILYGNKNSDLLFGGDGQDTLYGGKEDDTLIGESGNDLVLGDIGNDVLYGVTNLLLGYTLISDFTRNEDIIQLTGSADNYRLTDAPAGTGVGIGIIRIDAQGKQQYIGVVEGEGVSISSTSLTDSNFFQFV